MILGSAMVPHPPLIIPNVGLGSENKIIDTINAYKKVAKEIKEISPDTLIIISPHGECFSDAFFLYTGKTTTGNMGSFGAPEISFNEIYDTELINKILEINSNIPIVTSNNKNELDHGVMIPLYFINQEYHNFKIIRISISGLSTIKHYELGLLIQKATKELNKKYYIIASGDLSHCLKETGPYGYNEQGPIYDKRIMEDMSIGNFTNLFNYDESFLDIAAICGHKGFCIMSGILDGLEIISQKLSYEGPYGVGYGICTYQVQKEIDDNHYLDKWHTLKKNNMTKEDEYISLAREAINNYINNKQTIKPTNISRELLDNKAGVFVSLHYEGQLRGCIGTIIPTQENIAEEIIRNAINASSNDYRFSPLTIDELEYLDISVDVLKEPITISSIEELDVKKYGIIVSSGLKRGLLLPNLDNVTTVDEQIKYALIKGNINPKDDYLIEKFEVIRHENNL